ncbi:hypothetical protein JGI6_01977 [Candidatus Kryptonium thompsonii]|uniref:hypothetical protein n=1 Tax=Candidatus Kryptonium thompsonii TaxID=1633631 RepID=UPI00063EB744|nr:hypothetical protein [Candidatus Kryptonium thompsoni]CUS76548.1 hypothetical protein JGI6_01977 [Candidatus Kryptonium thompsoni]CUS88058.1 hypothetical protein JGI12_01118 [Candidatus Kryptonium thompsoni]CUS93338.1 hypothetical protein JGI15_10917 [Candidatus Kryptonium thompsoni]CUT01624.1 hypothetical protein JGI5_01401 [Candidatus Kryptonium thompsoni]
MSRVSLVVSVLIIFAASLYSQSVRDGKWWQGLDKNAKIYFVAGFWNGVTWGDDVLKDALANLQKNGIINQNAADAVFQKWTGYTDIGSTKVGEIVDRIDNLYSDPQNQAIVISDMMTVVVLNIQGLSLSTDVMQQLLQSYRQRR